MLTLIQSVLVEFCDAHHFTVDFLKLSLGCMVEAPAGCVYIDQLTDKHQCDFIGFDTNDLTELMFGISKRVSRLAKDQVPYHQQLFANDPFQKLDVPSVGKMLECSINGVKKQNRDTEVTVYGDHCSDKNSLRFLSHIGVDSVCCDPYLVPIATSVVTLTD